MGGNVRVGMEDAPWIGAGELAKSNAEQVTKARQIIEGLGLEIATSEEAREMLQLKGGDKVASSDRQRLAYATVALAVDFVMPSSSRRPFATPSACRIRRGAGRSPRATARPIL